MEYIIQNQYLKAKISSLGAELRELYDSNNINRIENELEKSKKNAPILLTII